MSMFRVVPIIIVTVVMAVGAAAPEPSIVLGPDAVTVEVGLPGTLRVVEAPSVSGPAARCGWYRLDLGGTAVLDVAAVRPVPGATYVVWCVTVATGATLGGYPTVAVYDPSAPFPGPAVSSYDAALHALARIRFDRPVAELSPPVAQVVGIPTWLAVVSPLDHPPVTAQAGPVWATVRAVPDDIEWDMGDGTLVTCAPGQQSRWSPAGPAPVAEPVCTHVYERRSEHGAWPGRVTARWTILWRSDRDPSWRVFDTIALASDLAVPVLDLQSVIR